VDGFVHFDEPRRGLGGSVMILRRLEAAALLLYVAVQQAAGAPQQQEGKSDAARQANRKDGLPASAKHAQHLVWCGVDHAFIWATAGPVCPRERTRC